MKVQEHAQTALDFLEAADQEFAAGDRLQGSEKMWGAASHAVMAVSQERDWSYGSHYALKSAADRLTEGDIALQGGFAVAEKFHANFYHDFMEEDELGRARPLVRYFVDRLLARDGKDGEG